MYGLTRATVTLIAVAAAGLLIWIATQISDSTNGGYWADYGLIAGAGLVMALSQLLGGWTKWGWPRLSLHVFLWAFVPTAIAVLWILIFHQPHHGLGRNHIRKWSNDIGIDGLVKDFKDYIGVLAFGLGLVFGYTFDTSGPVAREPRPAAAGTEPPPAVAPPAGSSEPPAREPATRAREDGPPA
jgi:drug/metabolite transporter superfamily protein YnfA